MVDEKFYRKIICSMERDYAARPRAPALRLHRTGSTGGASQSTDADRFTQPLPVSTSPKISDPQPLSQTPAPPAFLSGAALVEALRAGGYVMYIQSVESDQTQSNANIQNLQNCPSQSNLSEQDQINAQTIGTAILALGIPAGQVLYSASCSSHDTAMLAFGLGENWADLI
jgi:hypothetical protein